MDKLPLDWADIKGMTARIARDIAITNWRPDYVVGLTRGGLIPAVLLSHYFNVPMHTLKVTLRDGDESDCESNLWLAEDAFGYVPEEDREIYKSRWDPSLRKNILVVDDINDSGATIAWIKRDWQAGCLPGEETAWASIWGNNVKFAVLVENLSSKESTDFNAHEVNKAEHDVWIDFAWEDWWEKE
jgi:xanthine phosphoribosyltransferase